MGRLAGLAVLALLTACGCGDSGPSAFFSTSISGAGIRDVTVFTFTGASTDVTSPDYLWDFGDGAVDSGSVVTHVYTSEGTFQVRLRVAGSAGEAEASASVVVGSLGGTWASDPGSDGVWHQLTVTQQGNNLTGQWTVHVNPNSPWYKPGGANINSSDLSGTVRSPWNVALSQAGECRRSIRNGTVNANLTTMGSGDGAYGNPSCGQGRPSNFGGWLFHRR